MPGSKAPAATAQSAKHQTVPDLFVVSLLPLLENAIRGSADSAMRAVRVKLCKPAIVDLDDRIGDLLPVARAGAETLLDLDAVPAAGGEAVNDVLGAITAIPLVWGSDAHYHAGAGKRTIDGGLDFLL